MARTLFLLIITGLLCVAPQVEAESTLNAVCGGQASNRNLIASALKERILDEIDQGQFAEPRVRVRLQLIDVLQPDGGYTADEVVDGLSIIPHEHPDGLAFAVEGATLGNIICLYTYRVVVSTTARELATGERRTATTDSTIIIQDLATRRGRS